MGKTTLRGRINDDRPEKHFTSKETTNLTEFSFCDHKTSFDFLLLSRDQRNSIVEDRADFWKFVNKYEAMLKNAGKPVLSEPLEDEALSTSYRTHKLHCIPIQLNGDAKKNRHFPDHGRCSRDAIVTPLREKQFQEIVVIYLDFKQKERFAKVKKLRKTQQTLPIWKFKPILKKSLDETNVLIVAGDTGCGKSTQIPQYLYEFGYKSIGKKILAILN